MGSQRSNKRKFPSDPTGKLAGHTPDFQGKEVAPDSDRKKKNKARVEHDDGKSPGSHVSVYWDHDDGDQEPYPAIVLARHPVDQGKRFEYDLLYFDPESMGQVQRRFQDKGRVQPHPHSPRLTIASVKALDQKVRAGSKRRHKELAQMISGKFFGLAESSSVEPARELDLDWDSIEVPSTPLPAPVPSNDIEVNIEVNIEVKSRTLPERMREIELTLFGAPRAGGIVPRLQACRQEVCSMIGTEHDASSHSIEQMEELLEI